MCPHCSSCKGHKLRLVNGTTKGPGQRLLIGGCVGQWLPPLAVVSGLLGLNLVCTVSQLGALDQVI